MTLMRGSRLLVTALTFTTFLTISFLTWNHSSLEAEKSSTAELYELYCHGIENGEALPDISDITPNKFKRNIFFLETTCSSFRKGKLFIKPRQACAVESAARLNPNTDVYLLFASTGVIKDEDTESDRMLQLLNSYPNVRILHFNIDKYVKDSPVENLWTEEKIKESLYPVAHTSDILRLLTLWKFGGIYLDLDVVVIKNLEQFPDNFAGAQQDDLLANGVMGFSSFGRGRTYVNECLEDMSKHFDGKKWGQNGPQLITRNIFGHCPEFDAQTLIRFGSCEDFRIFPPSAFYLIPFPKWFWYFNENHTDSIVKFAEDNSYLIHVWNKLSYAELIPKENVGVPYLALASKYCPGIVQQIDEYF